MKCLIVKTSSLGDIIQTFPVLEYLKKKFPNAQIDWVVEESCADLLKTHPLVNKTICINTRLWRKSFFDSENLKKIRLVKNEIRKEKYDYVFDLQSNMKSSLITLSARSNIKVGFGFRTAHEWPSAFFTNRRYNPPKNVNIRDDYLHIVQSCFQETSPLESSGIQLKISSEQKHLITNMLLKPELQQAKKVMVCPGSAWKNKQLTEDALTSFLRSVQKQLSCGFIFVWGSQEECSLAQRLHQQFPEYSHVAARLPLPVLQNLMARLDLVITMDSLPLHLAGTAGTSTFSIFGASLASKYKPVGAKHQTLQGLCPYGRTFVKRCPILRTCETGACIRGLSGDDVFKAFLKEQSKLI